MRCRASVAPRGVGAAVQWAPLLLLQSKSACCIRYRVQVCQLSDIMFVLLLPQRVVLDACDLMGGFDLEPDPHGALGIVHVSVLWG